MYFEYIATGPQSDELVVDFAAAIGPVWASQQLPTIVSLFFDSDTATDVDVYLAPAPGASEFDRIMLVRAASSLHEARSCMPIWVDPATREPYQLRITTTAGNARVRVEWSRSVTGGC